MLLLSSRSLPACPAKLKDHPQSQSPWEWQTCQDIHGNHSTPISSDHYPLVKCYWWSLTNTRFPEVEVLKTTTATALVPKLDRIFATHGIPGIFTSDNGPPFDSAEITRFMETNGIQHNRTTPLWPQANAEVESFMKPLMKAIRTAHAERRNWRHELHKFLLNYRCTPHSTTNVAPATLLYGRTIKGRLPHLEHAVDIQAAREQALAKDNLAKERMKNYADGRRQAQQSTIQIGDMVLVKQPKTNKLSTSFETVPRRLIHLNGSMVTAARPDGHTITRNSSFFKKLEGDTVDPGHPPQHQADLPDGTGQALRPRRQSRLPLRLRDYETWCTSQWL